MMAPGTTANLKVLRNGSEHDMAVKLGELPTDKEQASVAAHQSPRGAGRSYRGERYRCRQFSSWVCLPIPRASS